MSTTKCLYLSCAETAKLVRSALKKSFPGVRFSVRSDIYAGGASIDVHWTDGPRQRDVEPVAGQYAGKSFDGSIDLAYRMEHYLRPDGSVFLAYSPGTEGNGGTHPKEDNTALAPVMPPDVQLVRFGANYVFCHREVSDYDAKVKDAGAWLRQNHSYMPGASPAGDRIGNDWVDNIATRMVYEQQQGEEWRAVFNRL